jgi:hypothetical protein
VEGRPVIAGLFFQHTGRAAGRTCLLDGTITVSGGRGGRSAWREGAFDLACRDGTRLSGTFRAKRSRVTLIRFEDRHAADIRSIFEPSEAAKQAAGSPPRPEWEESPPPTDPP